MRLLLRKLSTASQFSWDDWKIIGWTYLLFLKVRLRLLFRANRLVERSLRSTRHPEEPRPTSGRDDEGSRDSSATSWPQGDARCRHLLSFFHLAWRYQLPRPKCLATSLAKQAFLARYGFPVDLRIGVDKNKTEFKAHAWCGGNLSSFQTLVPLASESSEEQNP